MNEQGGTTKMKRIWEKLQTKWKKLVRLLIEKKETVKVVTILLAVEIVLIGSALAVRNWMGIESQNMIFYEVSIVFAGAISVFSLAMELQFRSKTKCVKSENVLNRIE